MAKRLFQESKYWIRLGAAYLNKTILPDAHTQMQVRRYKAQVQREAFVHVMFDESATVLDGCRLAFGLTKNDTNLDIAQSCNYKIYRVSNDSTPWQDTLVKSGTLSINADKLFLTTLTSVEAGADIFGDVTFKVSARVIRNNIPYYVTEYFNHLGITDKVERVRRKVTFLEITKQSVGE